MYGRSVDDDSLFFQHTYLTIVAKTMATRILGETLPPARDLLEGAPFAAASIHGAVESDFFDWVLDADDGADLVERIARQVSRFRLLDIESDVLRSLYESLIDPEQRHLLGEYYTPDWLASRVCDRAIKRPLDERVLDPAAGSGTFLFHAVRKFLAAADVAGIPNPEAVSQCCDKVLGIDVHPVAVIIARVNYLLAIGEQRLHEHAELAVPVYLGDSLQWNTTALLGRREVSIPVPASDANLNFPFAVTREPGLFDASINAMLGFIDEQADSPALQAWLMRQGITDKDDLHLLSETYDTLAKLCANGEDHIWGYVARNLARPIWLSTDGQRPDVIVGNPPWLSYRFMDAAMQKKFRDESSRLGVWVGGAGRVSHQDLSAYFFARATELYLDRGATIAFVMPFAALSRHHFEKFRSGSFASPQGRPKRDQLFASVRFEEAWGFDETVQPLFPVPSCVLIARAADAGPLPERMALYRGTLPRRDASPAEADAALERQLVPWPDVGAEESSVYKDRFRSGAIVFPRMLFVVERVAAGKMGGDPTAPLVRSRRTSLEKPPWRNLEPLEGRVEAQFLRPLYMGESIAPYRLLSAPLAVIPWDEGATTLLDRGAAQSKGHLHLGRWLGAVEELWHTHGKRKDEPLVPRLDYFGQLSAQMPGVPVRLVYSKAGTLPAAAILRDPRAVAENLLYWTDVTSVNEGRYLEAILNSETSRKAVAGSQSRGQWGARDFDKLMLELPIPAYSAGDELHAQLVAAAVRAEGVAAGVDLPPSVHFIRARGLIRAALERDGVAATIDRLVARLLQLETKSLG